jgi:hypothetical protein
MDLIFTSVSGMKPVKLIPGIKGGLENDMEILQTCKTTGGRLSY